MTVIRSILVPTDFSETSDAALGYAINMAQRFAAKLYLLHVPGPTGEGFEANFPVGRFETAARERLDAFLSPEAIAQLSPEYSLRIGSPAEEIVRYAAGRDVDLIIMGTHGRSGMAHMLMGSVAEHVVRTAPCPVLLVRHPNVAAAKAKAYRETEAVPS